MAIGMTAFWALLIYGVVWLGRGATPWGPKPPPMPPPVESPQRVLDRRLAAGELSVEEYQRLRAALGDDRTAPPPEPELHGAASGNPA